MRRREKGIRVQGLGGAGQAAWILVRDDWIWAATRAGLTERAALQVTETDHRGRPQSGGGFVVMESAADPSREKWGLLGFPIVPRAIRYDRKPDQQLSLLEPGPATGRLFS